MDDPRLLVKDAAGFTGVWREAHFEVWLKQGTPAMVRERFAAQRAYIASLAGKLIITISIVHEEAIRPLDGEMREEVNRNVASLTPHVKGAAIVIKATGFKAAVVRSIIGALTLFTRAKYPTKTHDDEEPALRWAAGLLEPDGAHAIAGDELLAAYRALVAAHGA